jgi:light-regulated signal transduction histidine kinase (bacteriophytochrome)
MKSLLKRLTPYLHKNKMDNRKHPITDEELNKFVYAVSHDLRAPLRQINDFMTLFMEGLDEELSDEKKMYKDILLECVKDADNIITTLNKYNQIKAQPDNIKSAPASQLYNQAITALSEKIQERRAQVVFNGDDISIHAYTDLIVIALIHLIDNATKFHEHDSTPNVNVTVTVTVTVTKDGDFVLFHVQDNGIGLSPDKAEHATTILRQLHPKGQFDGHGLGLAVVKKIASLHNGSLGLVKPDKGGTEIILRIKQVS